MSSHLKEKMGIDVSDDTVRRTLHRLALHRGSRLSRGLDVLKQACRVFFERLTNEDVLRLTGLAT